MSPLSQQNEYQAGDCSNIEDRQQRTHDRRSASSSSAHVDQSTQGIAVVARTLRNELQCSNLANTREQIRVYIKAISITAPRLWNDLPPELRTISLPPPPSLPITRHHLHLP